MYENEIFTSSGDTQFSSLTVVLRVRYSMGRTVVGYSTSIAILYFSTIDLLRGIQSIEVTVPIFDVQFITIMLLV